MTCSGSIGKYYIGDVGTEVLIDTCVDLATATFVKLIVLKPSGVTEDWDGVVTDDTYIQHFTDIGDFSVAGVYKLQAYVEMPSGSWRGNTFSFTVSANFT